MGPHLVIRVFVLVKCRRLILGLDIHELSDLIIFHDNHKHFEKKNIVNVLSFISCLNPSPFKADFDPLRLAPLYLANCP